MKLRMMALTAAVMMGQPVIVETAMAATLWKGVVVITARSNTAACIAEYAIGESFDILYRPNLGAAVDETIQVLGPNGGLLVTSTDPGDRTLRSGSLSVNGASYATGYGFTNPNNPLTISPGVITAATVGITITGTLRNAGVAGCNVTFRASLLPVFDGPL